MIPRSNNPLDQKETKQKSKINRPADSTLNSIADEIHAGMYNTTAMDFMGKKKIQIPSKDKIIDMLDSNPELLSHTKKLIRKYYHANKGGRDIGIEDIDREIILYQ